MAEQTPARPLISWPDAGREAAFEAWLGACAPSLGLRRETLRPASADASFRRYFRLAADGVGGPGTVIVMDAPPPQEDVRPFVHVAGLLRAAGLNTPRVLDVDEAQGFLLLSDLGERLYLQALRDADAAGADALMRDALAALARMQQHASPASLPPYDEALLRRELALFPEWCVGRHFGIHWDDGQRDAWERVCRLLVASALAQPRVAVHRDWMPRNLMVAEPNPGVLDFQDAVCGPVTYDLASLLRDAFISWDEEREIDWAVRGWEGARRAGLPVTDDFGEFWRQLEWMGLQRHLKVLGIFCRLQHRDAKPAYARDLPRFFGYATRVALRYRELAALLPLLEPMSGQALGAGYTF